MSDTESVAESLSESLADSYNEEEDYDENQDESSRSARATDSAGAYSEDFDSSHNDSTFLENTKSGSVSAREVEKNSHLQPLVQPSASTVPSVIYSTSVAESSYGNDDFDELSPRSVASSVRSSIRSSTARRYNTAPLLPPSIQENSGDSISTIATNHSRTSNRGEEGETESAYSTEFEEPSIIRITQTQEQNSLSTQKEIDELSKRLEISERELARLRNRDITLLLQKQERAKQRRLEHEQTLARACGEAEKRKHESEEFRLQVTESKSKQIVAESETRAMKSTIVRLETELELLRSKLQEESARVAVQIQEKLQLERKHQESLASVSLAHEEALQKVQDEFFQYRQNNENERSTFEMTCLERARAHEGRVDRMQASLETELVVLKRERESLARAQQEIQECLEHRLQHDRAALEAEKRSFEQERELEARGAAKARNELHDRERELRERELVFQQKEDSFARERSELITIRSCVETERDKLVAARQEADYARDTARAKLRDAEDKLRVAQLQIEEAKQEKFRLDRERERLAESQHLINDQKLGLERERARLDAMAVELAESLQTTLNTSNPAESRAALEMDITFDLADIAPSARWAGRRISSEGIDSHKNGDRRSNVHKTQSKESARSKQDRSKTVSFLHDQVGQKQNEQTRGWLSATSPTSSIPPRNKKSQTQSNSTSSARSWKPPAGELATNYHSMSSSDETSLWDSDLVKELINYPYIV